MVIGMVGSREMSEYGKIVIGLLMERLKDEEVATIDIKGCNREIIRLGAKKIFKGENFEELNISLANYVDKLIVVEGGENSGTFLVAQLVIELGKDVYCVPGRITDEGSTAPNWLIKNGAKILLSVENVINSND